MNDEPARVARLRDALGAHAPPARFAVVLGSGLGEVVDVLASAVAVPFGELPEMPTSSVAGHLGRFVFGELAGVPCAVMQGRVHAYEGHGAHDVVRGVRALRSLGIRDFVLTNAAGGIREDLEPGAFVALADQLNLTGLDPGEGLGDGPLGPRFPNLVGLYDASARDALRARAAERGQPLHEGVYAGRLGPSYETPAEVRMLATCGADAVGMSTVLEAIALARMQTRLVGISCITNRAAGRPGAVLEHGHVASTGQRMAQGLAELLRAYAEGLR